MIFNQLTSMTLSEHSSVNQLISDTDLMNSLQPAQYQHTGSISLTELSSHQVRSAHQ